MEGEADDEHDGEGDRPGGGGLADREPLREVVQAQPRGNHHGERLGGRGRRMLGPSEQPGIEVHEAQQADPDAGGEDQHQRRKAAIAVP